MSTYPWRVTPLDHGGERGETSRRSTDLGALLEREQFYRAGVNGVELVNVDTGEVIADLPVCMGTGCENRSSYAMVAMGVEVCWDHYSTVTSHESLMHDLAPDDRRQDAQVRYTLACLELGLCIAPLCWQKRTTADRCAAHAAQDAQ